MAPHVRPLAPNDVGPESAALIEEWGKAVFVPGLEGQTDVQFAGLLANHPTLLRGVMEFYGTFMGNTEYTSIRLKEFLRVTVAHAIGCSEYCTNLRMSYARDLAGVTEEDLDKVRNVDDSDLPAEEKAAIRFARQLVEHPRDMGAAFEEMKRYYTDAQIVEIGVIVAAYSGFGRMVVAFGLQNFESPLAIRLEPVGS